MTDGVLGPSPRAARPATALAVGLLTVAMMVGAVAAFAARLQDAVDLGTVHSDLLNTVDQALEPAHVTVWTAPAATASRPG
jgi:hypothetical protein